MPTSGRASAAKAGQTVSLRQEHTRLQTIVDSNASVATRLDASQAALKAIADDAQAFIEQLSVGAHRRCAGRAAGPGQGRAGEP